MHSGIFLFLSTQSGFINSFPFDPAGMNSPDMAVKEVKNGRLAMVSSSDALLQAVLRVSRGCRYSNRNRNRKCFSFGFESVNKQFSPPQVAFVGFAVQAIATRTQPIEGLTKHIADPIGKNFTYYLTHLPEVIAGTA